MNSRMPSSTGVFPSGRRSSGFSLVEIMVALVISLVLLGGVIQIFLGSRSSYALQQGMGQLQENARYILGLFNNEINMAGYQLTTQALDPNGKSTEGVGTAPDSIELTYISPTGTDCLNQSTAAAGNVAINYYYIQNNQLMCLGNGGATAQPLVDGVENMQILYGVDTDLPRDNIANQYLDTAAVTAAGEWGMVVSVRMAFLLDSVSNVRNGRDSGTYYLLNAPPITSTIYGANAADLLLRRRVFTRTFIMRNNFAY